MSGKTEKKYRRAFRKNQNLIADKLVFELLDAPFKYRFGFAMKLLFRRGK